MVNNVPTIKEAALIANALDRLGAYDEVELLDEFIEKAASASGDMVKIAGFWSDIWGRLKGRTKRIFIKEFREAHDSAKSVQEKLDKKIEEIQEKYDKASHALKTYQIADWYQALDNFSEAGGPEMLESSGFKDTYGRFMQAILGAKKTLEEKPEVEKVFGPEEKPEGEGKAPGKPSVSDWTSIVRRQPAVEEHFEGNKIRIQTPWWDRWVNKHLKRVPSKEGKILVKVLPSVTDDKGEVVQKTPANLEKGMGTDIWEVTNRDNDYVYLTKPAPVGVPKGAPEVVPEDVFEEPKLPDISKEIPEAVPSVEPEGEIPSDVEELFQAEPESEEPTAEKPSVKEPSETEKKMEQSEGERAEELGLKALEGATWIRYTDKARRDLMGMYRPVKKVRPGFHEIVTNKDTIKRLNDLWVSKYKKGLKGVPLEADDLVGCVSLASNRSKRINQILKLAIER